MLELTVITKLIQLLNATPKTPETEILQVLEHYPNIYPLSEITPELLENVNEINTLHDAKNALCLALELDYSADVINTFLRKGADMYQAAVYAALSHDDRMLEKINKTPVIGFQDINYKEFFEKNKLPVPTSPQAVDISLRLLEVINILRSPSTESHSHFFTKFDELSQEEKAQLLAYMPTLQQEVESIISMQQALVNTLIIHSCYLQQTSHYINKNIVTNETLKQNQIHELQLRQMQLINSTTAAPSEMPQQKIQDRNKIIHTLARSHVNDGTLCDFSLTNYIHYSSADIKEYLSYHLKKVSDVEVLYYKNAYRKGRKKRELNGTYDPDKLITEYQDGFKIFKEKIQKRLLSIIEKSDMLDDWKEDPILKIYTKDNLEELYKTNVAVTLERLTTIAKQAADRFVDGYEGNLNKKSANPTGPSITGSKRKEPESSDDEDNDKEIAKNNSSSVSDIKKTVLTRFQNASKKEPKAVFPMPNVLKK